MLNLEVKNKQDIEDFVTKHCNELIDVHYRTIGTQRIPNIFSVIGKNDTIRVVYELASPLRENSNITAVYKALDDYAYKGFLEDAFLGNVAEAATDAMPPHELELVSANIVNRFNIPIDPVPVTYNDIRSFSDRIMKTLTTMDRYPTDKEDANEVLLFLQAKIINDTYAFVLTQGNGLLIRDAIKAVIQSNASLNITSYTDLMDTIGHDVSRYVVTRTVKNGIENFDVWDKDKERFETNINKISFFHFYKQILDAK